MQLLHKYQPLLYKFILLSFGIWSISACKKEKTSWNARYLVPVVEDELGLSDLISDSFLTTEAGNYVIDYTQEVSRFDLTNIVDLPDTTFVETYFLPFNTTINPGFEFVNEVQDQDLDLSTIELKKVRANSGKIILRLENPYETTVFYTLSIPGVSKDGVPYEVVSPAPPGTVNDPSVTLVETDLSGYEFDLRGTSGDMFNRLQTQVAVQTDPNGPSVQSTAAHITRVNVFFEDIMLEYARGYFGQQVIEDTFRVQLDELFQIEGGFINLSDLDLKLRLLNGVKVDGELTIEKIIGKKNDGGSVALNSSQIGVKRPINRATGNPWNLNIQELLYSFSGNTILDFVEFLPDELEVVYRFELNPNGNISGHFDEFFPNSLIAFEMDIHAPLTLALDNLALSDTIDFDLSAIEEAVSPIKDARLISKIQNSFPIKLLVDIEFLDSNNQQVLEKKDITILSAASGSISALDSTLFGLSDFEIDLQEAIPNLYEVRKLRWKVRASTDITPNGFVSLNPSNKVIFKANLNIEYAHGEE